MHLSEDEKYQHIFKKQNMQSKLMDKVRKISHCLGYIQLRWKCSETPCPGNGQSAEDQLKKED